MQSCILPFQLLTQFLFVLFVWRLLQETESSQRSRPVSAFCFRVSHSAGHTAWHRKVWGSVLRWRHLCVTWVSQASEQVSEQLFSTSLSTVPFLPAQCFFFFFFFGHKHWAASSTKFLFMYVTKYIEMKVCQKHLRSGMSSTELTELSVNWFRHTVWKLFSWMSVSVWYKILGVECFQVKTFAPKPVQKYF